MNVKKDYIGFYFGKFEKLWMIICQHAGDSYWMIILNKKRVTENFFEDF